MKIQRLVEQLKEDELLYQKMCAALQPSQNRRIAIQAVVLLLEVVQVLLEAVINLLEVPIVLRQEVLTVLHVRLLALVVLVGGAEEDNKQTQIIPPK